MSVTSKIINAYRVHNGGNTCRMQMVVGENCKMLSLRFQLCGLVDGYQRFGGIHCLCLHYC
jgi:hypothetical protein